MTDDEGHRSFVLVNWATGKALGHCLGVGRDKLVPVRPLFSPISICETRRNSQREPISIMPCNNHNARCVLDHLFPWQVYLVGQNPDSVNVALLWTRSDDVGEGFHYLRTVSDRGIVLDAAEGGLEAGGAHDGTAIIIFPWNGGSNQKWKMLPFQ